MTNPATQIKPARSPILVPKFAAVKLNKMKSSEKERWLTRYFYAQELGLDEVEASNLAFSKTSMHQRDVADLNKDMLGR